MDSNPLAPDPRIAISAAQGAFADGLRVLERLTGGVVYVCTAPAAALPVPDSPRTVVAEFEGPHPAGLPGTHIHMLCPVDAHRSVWHIGYQDVIALGSLFTTGRLSTERIIALGGPPLADPCLLRTRTGAHIPELIEGSCAGDDEVRVIAGSVLAGTAVSGAIAYLGRCDNQVSVLREGREREFLAWLSPGARRWSVTNAFVSALRRHKPFGFNTSQNGSERAMVPIGSYERVVPLDILPTQLLRALLVGDTESALALGCLELAEEDLALCTVVCPSKYDYGPALRTVLDTIRKEG
jgi:Na+-transporting NADH:ubiquinone oxidoreductase subunit A